MPTCWSGPVLLTVAAAWLYRVTSTFERARGRPARTVPPRAVAADSGALETWPSLERPTSERCARDTGGPVADAAARLASPQHLVQKINALGISSSHELEARRRGIFHTQLLFVSPCSRPTPPFPTCCERAQSRGTSLASSSRCQTRLTPTVFLLRRLWLIAWLSRQNSIAVAVEQVTTSPHRLQ